MLNLMNFKFPNRIQNTMTDRTSQRNTPAEYNAHPTKSLANRWNGGRYEGDDLRRMLLGISIPCLFRMEGVGDDKFVNLRQTTGTAKSLELSLWKDICSVTGNGLNVNLIEGRMESNERAADAGWWRSRVESSCVNDALASFRIFLTCFPVTARVVCVHGAS